MLNKFQSSEPTIINNILNVLPVDSLVFVGNSMPIRYVELLKNTKLKYLASRGANGIDGQIATAIGIARSSKQVVTAIIGDLTFLYDANNILYNFPSNLKLHIIDNSGGRIFQRVKVPKEIIHEHEIDIKQIIMALGLNNSILVHKVVNDETDSFWNDWLNEEGL